MNFTFSPSKNKIGIALYITNKCQLRCSYCSVKNILGNDIVSFDKIKKILEYINKLKNVEYIYLLGGEPTLHPNIHEIIKLSTKYKKTILFTNGFMNKELQLYLSNKNFNIISSWHLEYKNDFQIDFYKQLSKREKNHIIYNIVYDLKYLQKYHSLINQTMIKHDILFFPTITNGIFYKNEGFDFNKIIEYNKLIKTTLLYIKHSNKIKDFEEFFNLDFSKIQNKYDLFLRNKFQKLNGYYSFINNQIDYCFNTNKFYTSDHIEISDISKYPKINIKKDPEMMFCDLLNYNLIKKGSK